MSLNTRELTLMSAIAIMVAIILAVTLSLYSSATDSHQQTLKRLEALESNKAKATAKRFTSEHAESLMKCMRIPNLTPAREACLQAIEMQIAEKASNK